MSTVSAETLRSIVTGDHGDPFGVLGCHHAERNGEPGIAIRTFAPEASKVNLLDGQSRKALAEMELVDGHGFFEAFLSGQRDRIAYILESVSHEGGTRRYHDPYCYGPIISEADLELFSQGKHWTVCDHLGSHQIEVEGVSGVHFSVWAPMARRVSVIGNFNRWDGRIHLMRRRHNGVWEIFIPGLSFGEIYKYEIKTQEGMLRIKSDPFALYSELRPANASIVYDLNGFTWSDEDWLARRADQKLLDAPMSIYEVHLGSWRRNPEANNRVLNYRELAHELAEYVTEMGFTHVELLPIAEYPYDPSWGYQVTGYFAVTSRYGTPDDFAYFVNHLHQHNVGVILDWVPAHFPRDDFALRRFDGSALFEHMDSRLGEHPDWGTLIFNLGRNEVRSFLIANACFWLERYHIDGLRVDAVASMLYLDYSREAGQWLPNRYGGRENLDAIDFFKELNEVVHERYPGAMTVAEESTAWPLVSRPTYVGGLGFTFKWNMGWMNDFLRYMRENPIHRRYHQNLITFSMMYAFSENFVLPLSHDEVVHGKGSLYGKMPGDEWQKFANLRVALGYMYGHPGKKLMFMGSEFGQPAEWNHAVSLDWHLLDYDFHRKLQRYVKELNQLYRNEPALHEIDYSWEGFQWIDFQDYDHSLISFLRRGKSPAELLVIACNFTPVPRFGYRLGVPKLGRYVELLNSDSEHFGGSNIGNQGGVPAEETPYHQQPASIAIDFPPLAVVVLKYQSFENSDDHRE